MLICTEISDKALQAETLAKRILNSLGEPILLPNESFGQVGCSIGIALFPENGSNPTALMKAADEAMYTVKVSGKHNFTYASE